jgi:excisionase family DNA binding protein
MEDQLTTAEAAELLNVSQPFVLKKLEAGELPFHMAGTQQGLRLVDVLAYRDRMDERAEAALTALTMEAEALGLCGE